MSYKLIYPLINSFMFADHEQDLDSPTAGSRSERSSSISTENTSPSSPDSSEPQTRRGGRGHYRGITFDDILPPHLITNAPPPGVDQKRGHHSSPAEPRHAAPTSSTTDATILDARPSTKRNYPTSKKSSGGKSRLRATARMLARGFSVVKRDSRGGRNGYEAV